MDDASDLYTSVCLAPELLGDAFLRRKASAALGCRGWPAQHIDRMLAGVADMKQLPSVAEQRVDSTHIFVSDDGDLSDFSNRANYRILRGDSYCFHG